MCGIFEQVFIPNRKPRSDECKLEEKDDQMHQREDHLTQLGNAIFEAIEIEVERQEKEQIDLTCIEIAKILIEIAHAHISFDMLNDEELSEYGCGDRQKLN